MLAECNVAGFVSNTGQIERVPYVFLPQRGQIIYPHAEIRFEGKLNQSEDIVKFYTLKIISNVTHTLCNSVVISRSMSPTLKALIFYTIKGVSMPVCGITGAQQLGRTGWSELRNLSDTEPPFRLFRDEGRTFLQVSYIK